MPLSGPTEVQQPSLSCFGEHRMVLGCCLILDRASASKHGKRDSFIDARTADHCHGFHSFPLRCDGAKSRRAVTLHSFGEWGVKGLRYLG
jgi:hypothetical protein